MHVLQRARPIRAYGSLGRVSIAVPRTAMGSKAPFRARIGHIRYCSHRYRIAALRQYMARPAKPIKLTAAVGDLFGQPVAALTRFSDRS